MSRDAITRPIDSSLIRRVTYGRDATLTVHLHRGAVYRYFTVPRTVFETELGGTSALMRSLVLKLINHVAR